MPANVKRQKSYPACGRLVVLQALGEHNILDSLAASENRAGFVAINFPSMPDAIDLVRRADYTVSSPIGFPDGIHMYKGTAPLKIPFSFKIHSLDTEYCPKGARTLLEVAAALEALVVPFGSAKAVLKWGTSAESPGSPAPNDAAYVNATAKEPTSTWHTPPENIFPPATCYLELILTERDGVGIACVGYVEEVRIKLLGPFLRGPGISQNLPTAGEFEFTFVHHPGHGNAYQANTVGNRPEEQQAFAQVVKDRLFNTVGLMTNQSNFTGFSDSGDAAQSAPSGPRQRQFGSSQTEEVGGFLIENSGPVSR